MSRLVRNSAFNLTTQIASVIAALVGIPIAFRILGPERFGLLTIAWSLLSYTILFDFGTGPAVARAVASSVARDHGTRIRAIAVAGAGIQLVLGAIGAILLLALSTQLLGWLNVPSQFMNEGRLSLYALALAVPVVLLTQSQQGMLEGLEKFDVIAYVRGPVAIATYAVPAIGALAGWSIAAMIFTIVATRALALAVMMVVNHRALPAGQHGNVRAEARGLFGYGKWLAVSGTIAQIMTYLDRFLLSSMHGLAAVAQYGAPYDAASKLLALPASIGNAMFPGMTKDAALDNHGAALDRTRKAARITLALLAPVALFAIVFAGPLLRFWLGDQIQGEGILAFQILIVAMALHAVAYPPIYLIEAFGRTDVVARFHIVELFIYVPVALYLIARSGVAGAAVAWALRGLAVMLWAHIYASRWK